MCNLHTVRLNSEVGRLARAGRSGDRTPVGGGEDFRTRKDGPGAHRDSYTIGARSLPGVKPLGRGLDYPPRSSAEVKDIVELYLHATFVACCRVSFIFTFTF